MEQSDLKPKDLTPMISNLNGVYEILGYKRALTLPMIRRLHRDVHIPAQSLISETGEGQVEVLETREDTLKLEFV